LPIIALALVAAACGEGESTTSTPTTSEVGTDLGGREVTIAVENLYPPFNYLDPATNEGTGWDYDVWREICDRLNCVPVFVEAVWPDMIIETGQGVYDTAGDGISITEDRKLEVAFSDSYMTTEQKLMVKLDDDRFASVQEFLDDPDARLATQIGTTNYELAVSLLADYGGEARIDAFPDFPVAVQELIAGSVDAVIIDDVAGQGFQGLNADQLKLIDEPLKSDPLGFIYAHDSELVEPVNQIIAEMKADGFLDSMTVKWFIDFDPASLEG
jgi:polar amino acid transport system substrate-binding protein